MNSLLTAANAVLPITAMMALGFLTKRIGAVKDSSYKDFNWVVFHYCLPLTLFQNVLNADFSKITDMRIFLFAVGGLLLLILLSMAFLKNSSMPDKRKGVVVQALYRTNFAILGLPIVESVYGAGNTAFTSVMIAVCLPFFNIAAVLVLQHYSGTKSNLLGTVKKVLRNPMVVCAIAGVIVKMLGIPVKGLPADIISMITKLTTPLSLFVLGGSIHEDEVKNNSRILAFVTVMRLVVIPLVAITLGALIGWRGVELLTLLVLFGGPVAVSSYPMAAQMGLDGELAAQCILVSTVFVMLSMFAFITGLSMLGLL